MDREQVVKLLRDIQNSPGFYNDIAKKDVILNYCVEHGKSPQLSIQFVQIISINRVLLNEIFLDTLEMLKKEHTINILYASQNSINRGNNPILLIY
jgi:hypothetical protein